MKPVNSAVLLSNPMGIPNNWLSILRLIGFCIINPTGTSLLWYITSTGGIPANSTDVLTSRTYYVSQTINGCESINRVPVVVTIHETVVLPSSIPDLFECDSMVDGDDTNGFATFDLTTNEPVLLNGKSASDFSFYYFTDLAYSNPISTPVNAFINTTIQIICRITPCQ